MMKMQQCKNTKNAYVRSAVSLSYVVSPSVRLSSATL